MRISDWGSDVYSSYLKGCGRQATSCCRSPFVLARRRWAWRRPLKRPEKAACDWGRERASPMAGIARRVLAVPGRCRSEEHTSELQSLMRTSYAVFCLKKNKKEKTQNIRLYSN